MMTGLTTAIVKLLDALCGVGKQLSCAWMTGLVVCTVVGVPLIKPPEERERPAGKIPEVTAQVIGETPPEDCNWKD
jgi:hypothetical protein